MGGGGQGGGPEKEERTHGWQRRQRHHSPPDRGREGRLPGPPSLRTGLADLPHPALRLVVLPPRGLTELGVGCGKGKQPLLSKEGIRPAVVVQTPGSAFPLLAMTENTA